jgi:hypothetical protein
MVVVRRSPVTTNADDVLAAIGDESEWGEPEPARPRKSEKRRRGVMVSVRLSPEEFELLESHAKTTGIPLGTFMRQQALACTRPVQTTTWAACLSMSRPTEPAPAWHSTFAGLEKSLNLTNAGG